MWFRWNWRLNLSVYIGINVFGIKYGYSLWNKNINVMYKYFIICNNLKNKINWELRGWSVYVFF